MSPAPSRTVFKVKPFDLSYCDAMSQMRMWLDHNKIQPCKFRMVAENKIGFEVTFSSEDDAAKFGAFGWPLV